MKMRTGALGLFVLMAGAGLLRSEMKAGPSPEEIGQLLGGAQRHRTHPATDKPVYRPGETVRVSAAVLDAATHRPTLPTGAPATVKIKSPRGDVVTESTVYVADSTIGFEWPIPAAQPGGEYKAIVELPGNGAPGEIAFSVRAYRAPRLRTDLQFARKAYGPGDTVTASLTATRAEGGLPAGAKVTAVATVDGAEVHRATLALDATGALSVSFPLPKDIRQGNGTLALIIEDGGVQETAAKSLPIVLARMSLELFPEGGELVAGLPARVYVEARSFQGLPADTAGRVLDGGREVAKFRTEHEGRGRFAFTPEVGKKYVVAIDEPTGIEERFELPAVQAKGVSLIALDDVVAAGAPLRVQLATTGSGAAAVQVARLEKTVVSKTVSLTPGKPVEASLDCGDADGVLRVTVLDGRGVPRAERLVFRRPAHALELEVVATPDAVVPGGRVSVKVTATRAGKPAQAVVAATVVDDSVLETIDKRDRAPRLPVQVLLGSDVRELADAHVYLGSDPIAPLATDLLLGTQGWRRFAFADPSKFLEKHTDLAKRVLAKVDPPPPPAAVLEEGAVLGGGAAVPMMAPMAPPPMARAEPVDKAIEKGAADAPAPPADIVAKDAAAANQADAQAEKPAADAKKQRAAMDGDDARPMRQQGAGRAFAPRGKLRELGRRMAADEEAGIAAPAAVVRVYAHQVGPDRAPNQRTDFTETLYWNAGVATDDKGVATFEFGLSDAVTTFRVRADAFAKDGSLGEGDVTVESRRPFYAEAKLPLRMTAGDVARAPVVLVNGTGEPIDGSFSLAAGAGLAAKDAGDKVKLAAKSSARSLVELTAQPHKGAVKVEVSASGGSFMDSVAREVPVDPAGFPIELAFGGKLDGKKSHAVDIPVDVEPSALYAEAAIYPTPTASLTEALARMLQEPGGCFEQTSSTNYPNVMVMQYLKSHRVEDPSLVERCQGLVKNGYNRLVGFECKQKGYEWFGSDPGHEALSAYGILEFTDMAQVYPVDTAMIERTRAWLLSRRDGKGGFLRSGQALDTFGRAPEDITDAYIVWALVESGQTGIDAEIALLKSRAGTSNDPYLVALAAAALTRLGDPAAKDVCKRLAGFQEKDGSLTGTRMSITGSSGSALAVETTSLATIAWLRTPDHALNSSNAGQWLLEQCKGGSFGSTQATILALRAVVALDDANAKPKQNGTVLVSIDGKVVDEQPFTAAQTGPVKLPKFNDKLTPGKHTIELSMVNGSPMPYSLAIRYHTQKPATSEKCRVALTTRLAKTEIGEGEAVDLTVSVKNKTKAGLPMTLAVVGLPAGLEPRADQLKELVKSARIDFYETRGRDLVLYWRGMAPDDGRDVVVSLLAAIPGTYTGPASRGYLYYSDEDKHWVDPLKVTIAAR